MKRLRNGLPICPRSGWGDFIHIESGENKMVKNIAHRGFSGKYPENTLLAFQMACETPGCDGIEIDVQLTKDNVPVIIHDEKIDRTCVDGTGYVLEYTYEELKKFDVSYKFAGQFKKQHIPTLREYFELVKDYDIMTNVELKTGIIEYPGIEQIVCNLIREYQMEKKVIISSFNHFTIMRMKKICPELKCGLLTESWIVDAGKYTENLNIECFHPVYLSLNEETVAEIKGYGIEINTWTVNEEEDIRDMIEKGVDAVIGNYPDRVTKVRKEME